MSSAVECVVVSRDHLGESPLWDEGEQALWWVDINARAIKRFDGAVKVFPMPQQVGSLAFRAGGGLLAAMQAGVYLWENGRLEPFARPDSIAPSHRFNDGRCDRSGNYFWAGTMNHAKREPTGSLYRVSPDGRCEEKRSGITVPNSLSWSPDGRTMYFADSPRRTIWAYDYDPGSGEASNERVFATTAPGFPDGSCVDADGCLWNAEYGGWRVVRYTPRGRIDRAIALPVQQPTCCCFGGERLDLLFITSASQQLKPEQLARQPLAGSVFAVWPGSTGLPEPRFAG